MRRPDGVLSPARGGRAISYLRALAGGLQQAARDILAEMETRPAPRYDVAAATLIKGKASANGNRFDPLRDRKFDRPRDPGQRLLGPIWTPKRLGAHPAVIERSGTQGRA